MTPRQQDGYLMLDDLHRRYCTDPDQNYFNNWYQAVKDYSAKRKQSLIDLAADAANLTHSIRLNAANYANESIRQKNLRLLATLRIMARLIAQSLLIPTIPTN